MEDPLLRELAIQIGQEGMPVVVNPVILDPKDFLQEVLCVRLPNPYIPDTPQRIATDTSQKMSIRYGETIKAYQKAGRSLKQLHAIPLVIAGWIRYLTGVDDSGNVMKLSPDPRIEELREKISDIADNPEKAARLIMSDVSVFGQDLSRTELFVTVTCYLKEMLGRTAGSTKNLGKISQIIRLYFRVIYAIMR